jgi:2-phosphosulfolactate phosphatase
MSSMNKAAYFDQHHSEVRCEWGLAGLQACLPGSEVVVIVDVLSFSTTVDIGVGRGAAILPYAQRGESAEAFARDQGALLASRERGAAYSLSPASLLTLPAGARLVVPSPNGSTLSLATGVVPTLAGCLRNAASVARAAAALGRRVLVVAAGEHWPGSGLRFALEDWLGAGAIIHGLPGARSAEAAAAEAAFLEAENRLTDVLLACGSGRELREQGFEADVRLAADLNASQAAPLLQAGAYRPARTTV